MLSSRRIPVVDVFAGPGGLGEGFASLESEDGSRPFDLRLSIEKDQRAHQTLRLRSFFRSFGNDIPKDYYQTLSNTELRWKQKLDCLYDKYPANKESADNEARRAELGEVSENEVDSWIEEAIEGRNDWVLVGGPPCQAYSVAGRARNRSKDRYVAEEDHRHFLYQHYLRIIAKHRPAMFVMENVPGLLSATVKNEQMFQRIIDDLSAPADGLNYDICSLNPAGALLPERKIFVVEMDKHGIPQARKRVFIVGVRSDLNLQVDHLTELPKRSVRSVLDTLPPVRSGLSKEKDSHRNWLNRLEEVLSAEWPREHELLPRITNAVEKAATIESRGGEAVFQKERLTPVNGWEQDPRLEHVWNHTARSHRFDDLHRYLFASAYAEEHGCSPSLPDFPEELYPNHKNLKAALKKGHFADRFRVQTWESPSKTITAHISKDGHYYIHPDPAQCRSLTAREAARLQTFPDDYFFAGPRTSQYRQIGNAVPPALARQIADNIYRALSGRSESKNSDAAKSGVGIADIRAE